jgi:hypothetical protein
MDHFRQGSPLPPGYGIGIDERCIEYPLLLAHLNDKPEILLDAGSALNHDYILNHTILDKKTIHIITLAPEHDCYWKRGISYLFHDLRMIPIRGDYYDSISCISTLEHIGCDNSQYAHNFSYDEQNLADYVLVMQELARVLKSGGSLFITVPFGIYCNMGVQQQFDAKLLDRTIEAFGKANQVRKEFYRYTRGGWSRADVSACVQSEYVKWSVKAWLREDRLKPLPLEPDMAAAARAVACVHLTKP